MGKISRRDFVNGTLMAAGASLLPFGCTSPSALETLSSDYYPPALTGLRGSQPGSNTHAHARAWNKRSDWGPVDRLKEEYDLVVVGGGISGLTAAYFYHQKHGSDKKILILDNHDDFGGHARRNEHKINGDVRLMHGGSQTLVHPTEEPELILNLLHDIGVDLNRFETAYDAKFYTIHNLGPATYFNKAYFGVDKVVKHPFCNYPNFVEGLNSIKISSEEAVEQAPLTRKGKEQLARVLAGGLHLLDVPEEELEAYITTTPYYDYLKNNLRVDDPAVLRMARYSANDWGRGGTDVMTIAEAKGRGALGFELKEKYDEKHPYIHHFPDGNATVARLLVKKLIPAIGTGNNAEEIILSKFKYNELDKTDNVVRLRLNSTVVKVQHGGDPKTSSEVFVDYVCDNKAHQVKAKGVVLACYNMMIPHIVPDLPAEQAAALRRQSKVPLQYTSVGLRNWKAIREAEIGMVMSPGNMHQVMFMDFPVSMGGYEFTKSPEDPCVMQLTSLPTGTSEGAPSIEQFKEARYKMLSLQFNDYEEELRSHLTGMLPSGTFDFDRDVATITVNRWPHGYSYGGNALFDTDMMDLVKIGRRPFERITIANSDSAPYPSAFVAMKMAYRAVEELG